MTTEMSKFHGRCFPSDETDVKKSSRSRGIRVLETGAQAGDWRMMVFLQGEPSSHLELRPSWFQSFARLREQVSLVDL